MQVYQQIVSDLNQAQQLLSPNFLDGTLLNQTTDRVRPTQWSATALLARAYLYAGNMTSNSSYYSEADSAASAIISNSTQFGLAGLDSAFLKASLGNNEAIWQLQTVAPGFDTWEGAYFIVPSTVIRLRARCRFIPSMKRSAHA